MSIVSHHVAYFLSSPKFATLKIKSSWHDRCISYYRVKLMIKDYNFTRVHNLLYSYLLIHMISCYFIFHNIRNNCAILALLDQKTELIYMNLTRRHHHLYGRITRIT